MIVPAICDYCEEEIKFSSWVFGDAYDPPRWLHASGCVVYTQCIDRRPGMRRARLDTVATPRSMEKRRQLGEVS